MIKVSNNKKEFTCITYITNLRELGLKLNANYHNMNQSAISV